MIQILKYSLKSLAILAKRMLLTSVMLSGIFIIGCNKIKPQESPQGNVPKAKKEQSESEADKNKKSNDDLNSKKPPNQPSAAGLVIIKKNHKGAKGPYVLAHMRSVGLGGVLCGPGGSLDGDPPKKAGSREAHEEAGLNIPENELVELGVDGHVTMLRWIYPDDTAVPGPLKKYAHEIDDKAKATDYDAQDAGGSHMWLNLDSLEKAKTLNKINLTFYKYAKQELGKP